MEKSYLLADMRHAQIILDVLRGVAEDKHFNSVSEDLGKVSAVIADAYQFIQEQTGYNNE